MESMIEKLFRETGRTIDRRQFVQGDLALAATAAAVSLPTEAAARQGIKTTWVSHYTYVAPDMKKTRDWYHEVFGMQMGYEDRNEAHLWYGATGGDTLMIVRQARAGEGAPRLERFAFMVDPWDGNTVQAALRRRGARTSRPRSQGLLVQRSGWKRGRRLCQRLRRAADGFPLPAPGVAGVERQPHRRDLE